MQVICFKTAPLNHTSCFSLATLKPTFRRCHCFGRQAIYTLDIILPFAIAKYKAHKQLFWPYFHLETKRNVAAFYLVKIGQFPPCLYAYFVVFNSAPRSCIFSTKLLPKQIQRKGMLIQIRCPRMAYFLPMRKIAAFKTKISLWISIGSSIKACLLEKDGEMHCEL